MIKLFTKSPMPELDRALLILEKAEKEDNVNAYVYWLNRIETILTKYSKLN